MTKTYIFECSECGTKKQEKKEDFLRCKLCGSSLFYIKVKDEQ